MNLLNKLIKQKLVVNKDAKTVAGVFGLDDEAANKINKKVKSLVDSYEGQTIEISRVVKDMLKTRLINNDRKLAYGMFVIGNLTEKYTVDRQLKDVVLKEALTHKLQRLKSEGKLEDMTLN